MGTILRDSGARWVLGGWTLFTVENVVLSEYRGEIKRAWGGHGGPKAYQSLYTIFSTATMASTVYAYWRFAGHSTVVSAARASPAVRALAFGFRAFGFVLLGQLCPPVNLSAAPIALGVKKLSDELTPQQKGALGCPFDFNAYSDRDELFGITRVSRRPELWGLASVGIAGALMATTAAEVAFWGIGPVVCFAILGPHSDRTQLKSGDMSPRKEAETRGTPFLALLQGRQSWSAVFQELDPVNFGVGIGTAFLAVFRPPWLRWVR